MKVREQKWYISNFIPEPKDVSVVFIDPENGAQQHPNRMMMGWARVGYDRIENNVRLYDDFWMACVMSDKMELIPVPQFEHESGLKMVDFGIAIAIGEEE